MNKQDGFGHEKPGEGATNDWITPKWVFDALGEFDLDPCESNNQPWTSAKRGYRLCRGEDGLALPWEGAVWCNPPYGSHVGHWIKKCAAHGNAVMLIFSRCETIAWHEIWKSASAVMAVTPRISFCRPDGSKANGGTAPSSLIAFGPEAVSRLRNQTLISGALCTSWEWKFYGKTNRKVDGTRKSRLGKSDGILPQRREEATYRLQLSLAGCATGVSPTEGI